MFKPLTFHRSFATSLKPFKQQKTLVQKIASTHTNKYNLGLVDSTLLFWKWLISNPKSTLQNYQDEILKTLDLSHSVKVESKIVAGLGEIELLNKQAKIATPTLLIHGHAASGIFYHRNFPKLSSNFQKLYAIDLPEIGLSDKKKIDITPVDVQVEFIKQENEATRYKVNQDISQTIKSVRNVENYYIEAIENWRQHHKFDQINLVGHSFGGYMSFKYALKYPQHIKKLILVSPAGMERSIYSTHNDHNEGIISQNPSSPDYYRAPFLPKYVSKYGFGIMKALGPLGISLISKFLSTRFTRGPLYDKKQLDLFLKFTINLFYQKNNSLDLLRVIVNRSLLAPSPILDSIDTLKVDTFIMYGQHDWMNVSAGYNAVNELQSSGKFGIIEKAGHNISLDNPDDFDKEVIEYLKED